MSATNICFYICTMTLFTAEGWILSILLPFHARANEKELLSKRLISLDGLRGPLALSVFFSHAASFYYYEKTSLWNWPPSNFYSQLAIAPVSMFFFITGYLFWSKLASTPKLPMWDFWVARMGRLAPVYAAACLCAFSLAAFQSEFHRNISIPTLLTQLAKWLAFDGTTDINSVQDSHLWLGAAWSLRFEWAFYLLLPFLGWFARKARWTLLLIGLATTATMAFHAHYGSGQLHKFFPAFTEYFAYTFSVGFLLASVPLGRFRAFACGRAATLLSISAIALTLVAVPPEYGVLESACLCFPFACTCLGNDCFGLLSSRALRFLGRISYSFYLLHYLGLTLVLSTLKRRGLLDGISPVHYWIIATATGMGVILICAFSYQCLEAPFLHVTLSKRDKKTYGFALEQVTVVSSVSSDDPER